MELNEFLPAFCQSFKYLLKKNCETQALVVDLLFEQARKIFDDFTE